MKKERNKRIKKWIVIIVLFTFVILASNVYAAISTKAPIEENFIDQLIGIIMNTAGGILGTPFAMLINVFSLLIFLVLYLLYAGMGINSGGAFPFPDQIVFNQLSFFDPNFINPAADSPANMIQDIIKSMYYSLFVLAGTFFVIAAMIIGIKLAIASLAAEKARYKQALNNWILGILLLFVVHYLMAAVFYLNEQIVEIALESSSEIAIKFDWLDAVPVIGKPISRIVNGVAHLFTGTDTSVTTINMYGYGGLIGMFALKAFIGQDLVSSIVFLIVIGQSLGLVVMYIKRMIMCFILGMIAPLIVAVDVIKKSFS
ncbi:MAG: hypothetical protein PHR25_00060 [Clostridia bacterium]|nr:hypothetical protein [Clostridia bacterium]MDD4375168.1 hypothetical protein [Clostridia bacterium]